MFDLLIRNAQVLDGTGAPAYLADVAVKDGKIAAVGKLSGEAAETADAAGLNADRQQVRTHGRDGLRNRRRRSLSDGNQHDYAHHADDDAEHRQERTNLVAGYRLKRHGNRLRKLHQITTSFSSAGSSTRPS